MMARITICQTQQDRYREILDTQGSFSVNKHAMLSKKNGIFQPHLVMILKVQLHFQLLKKH